MLVPYAQSREFNDALKRAGVDVLLQSIPGGNHGGPQYQSSGIMRLYKNFFDKHLKGSDVKVDLVSSSDLAAPTK